jgi:hypothetical protein
MSRRGEHPETPAGVHAVETSTWKDRARRWVGRVCVPWLRGSYLARIADDYYLDQEPAAFFRRAIRDELTRRYYGRPEAERRAENRRRFWGGMAGHRWHESRRRWYQEPGRFRDGYLKSRARMLEHIRWLLDRCPAIKTICEVGTGNGMMVDYLAGHFTQVERFHGIDLCAEQVARNREFYGESRVEYLHVEPGEYILRHGQPGTLFVACGTFECFTQAELEEFLALTRRMIGPVAFACSDAVDIEFDPDVEFRSRPRGNLLYNHNYRHLLETHGYQICFYQVERPNSIYDRHSILAIGSALNEVRVCSRTPH